MKIAYVSTLRSSSWGGSEELWHQSAEEAIKLKCEIGVFVYEWPDEPPKIAGLRAQGAFIHKRRKADSLLKRIAAKGITKIAGKGLYSLNPYKALVSFRPDIVIVTDGSTYYASDDNDLSYVLLNMFKDRYVIISQSNTDYHLPSDRQHAIRLFENAMHVFFVAANNRDLSCHQLAHHLTRTELIQNPVLLDSLDMIPFPKPDGLIHCAVIGRFCISDKGQDILIAMLEDDSWKSSNIKLHLYGKGDDKQYLEQLIAFYGVGDKVVIEGFTDNKNDIWNKCHCLLMCSHAEGTPLSLLEAMIAGRICIVTRVGGNDEWIKDGENGFLAEAATKRLFDAKLKEAISVFSKWEAIARRAHESVKEKLQLNPGRALIEKILAGRNG